MTNSQPETVSDDQVKDKMIDHRLEMIELDHVTYRLGWWMEHGKNYVVDRDSALKENNTERAYIYSELARLSLKKAKEMAQFGLEILQRVKNYPMVNKAAVREAEDTFLEVLNLDPEKIQ